MRDSNIHGLIVIDKPEGITSHDVVQRVRKLLKTSRVGHLGTLDPMATGVLPLCVGKATRIGRFFSSTPKEYVGEIRFGFATTTYDKEGAPTTAQQPLVHGREDIEAAMRVLTGLYEQKPPRISAKKMGGIPSYKLARRGFDLEPEPVPVHVMSFDVVTFEPPRVAFRVLCSPGTYVRSLAHDLGLGLGCGAHLESLRRLRSGEFTARQAIPLDAVTPEKLTPLEALLTELPLIEIEGEVEEDRVCHGNPFLTDRPGGLARIFNKKGQFLAVAFIENGWAHPRVVLTSITSAEPRKPH